MGKKKRLKRRKGEPNTNKLTRGFLVDFSDYRENIWPIEDAYSSRKLINKIGAFINEMLWTQNPTRNICGLKIEPLNPKTDKNTIRSCNFVGGNIYYASFPSGPEGFVFGVNTSTRFIHILGASPKHVFRPWHGKFG